MKQKTAVLILTLVTALFITMPMVSVIKSVRIKKHGIQAEGTVTGRSGSKGLRTVTVSFTTADGTEVTAKAAKRNFVANGDKVMIWYDPVFPQKIDFGDTIGYNMRGAVISGLVFFLGLYFFIRYSLTEKANKKLISSGKKIAAEFVSVERNEKYRMGDKNPWVIKCKWTDTLNKKEYHFVSKEYIIDPTPHLKGRSHIDVFINPADPRKYYMDNSFMPEGNITMG